MAALFKTPKIPKPPAVPTRDVAAEQQDITDRMRKRRGSAAAILTGAQGDTAPVPTAAKILTGL